MFHGLYIVITNEYACEALYSMWQQISGSRTLLFVDQECFAIVDT